MQERGAVTHSVKSGSTIAFVCESDCTWRVVRFRVQPLAAVSVPSREAARRGSADVGVGKGADWNQRHRSRHSYAAAC
jgi:hypothetical protein